MAVSIMAKSKPETGQWTNSAANPASSSANCVVAKGTTIEGLFQSSENVRLDGTVLGDVVCEKKLVLGESGKVEGKVRSNSAVVMGHIIGEINVEGLLHLNGTANIEGDIVAKKMTMDEGARYNGGCKIG